MHFDIHDDVLDPCRSAPKSSDGQFLYIAEFDDATKIGISGDVAKRVRTLIGSSGRAFKRVAVSRQCSMVMHRAEKELLDALALHCIGDTEWVSLSLGSVLEEARLLDMPEREADTQAGREDGEALLEGLIVWQLEKQVALLRHALPRAMIDTTVHTACTIMWEARKSANRRSQERWGEDVFDLPASFDEFLEASRFESLVREHCSDLIKEDVGGQIDSLVQQAVNEVFDISDGDCVGPDSS